MHKLADTIIIAGNWLLLLVLVTAALAAAFVERGPLACVIAVFAMLQWVTMPDSP